MSAAATSPAPPPSAWPCTRATTGAGQLSIASNICRIAFASATFSSNESPTDERIQSTSAPAQKLAPSPASTTARALPTSTNACASSRISSASNALRRSGRASVTRSTDRRRARLGRCATTVRRRIESAAMLRGAIAAALTPLAGGGAVARRGRVRALPRLPRVARASTACSRSARRARACSSTSRSASALPSSSSRAGERCRSPCTAARRRPPTPSRSPSTRRRPARTRSP